MIWGATGGYLIGFVIAGALVGRLAELGWDRRLGGALGAMLLGSAVIYAIGLPWLAVVAGMSIADTVANGLTPFLLGDALKLCFAAVLFPRPGGWWAAARTTARGRTRRTVRGAALPARRALATHAPQGALVHGLARRLAPNRPAGAPGHRGDRRPRAALPAPRAHSRTSGALVHGLARRLAPNRPAGAPVAVGRQ